MRRERGFTLVEIMVALAVGVIVVALAHQLVRTAGDLGVTIRSARAGAARDVNGRWALHRALGSVVQGGGADRFGGQAARLDFTTWWSDERGRRIRRRCTITVEQGHLVLTGLEGAPLVLAESVSALRLDYLTAFGERASWHRGFESQLLLPVAVRVRIARTERTDTLLVPLGVAG